MRRRGAVLRIQNWNFVSKQIETGDVCGSKLVSGARAHIASKQKPHPGEKPSEAFALAPDGLDSGRKLNF
jgi:hypothetical protein